MNDTARLDEPRKHLNRLLRWEGGHSTGAAAAADLIGKLDPSHIDHRTAQTLILLGMMSECDPAPHSPGSVSATISGSLDIYLKILEVAGRRRMYQFDAVPVWLAVLYLLGHLPEHRTRIIEALTAVSDPSDDMAVSRIDRCLQQPDPGDPALADFAGRSWPAPAALAFTAIELATTSAARRALSPQVLLEQWSIDTQAMLACAGAEAVAAIGEWS